MGLHRDPDHFPNPMKFDPDRFSDERKGSIKPYTYFPFGEGKRACIGNKELHQNNNIVMKYVIEFYF